MSLHNEAKKEDIEKIVIMPGDPLRAKYIAENFLKEAKLVNSIRGMYAYTGMEDIFRAGIPEGNPFVK